MPLLIVTNYRLPHLGGIEALAFGQAKTLVHKGYLVAIISSRTNNEPENEIMRMLKYLELLHLIFLKIIQVSPILFSQGRCFLSCPTNFHYLVCQTT
jgi:RAB protein geranylgeranyltransferase component A